LTQHTHKEFNEFKGVIIYVIAIAIAAAIVTAATDCEGVINDERLRWGESYGNEKWLRFDERLFLPTVYRWRMAAIAIATAVLRSLLLPVQLIVAIVGRAAGAHRIQLWGESQLDQLSLFFDRFRECLGIPNCTCKKEFGWCTCSLGWWMVVFGWNITKKAKLVVIVTITVIIVVVCEVVKSSVDCMSERRQFVIVTVAMVVVIIDRFGTVQVIIIIIVIDK